jgi:hypothetical protein
MISHLITIVIMFLENLSDQFNAINKRIILGDLNFCVGKIKSNIPKLGG